MRNSLVILSIMLLSLSGCVKDEDTGTQTVDQIFNLEQLTSAADYSKLNGGSAVLVMVNDSIVFEDYHNDANQNTATHLHSATKLFWVSACALAKQQGLLNYDELVSNTITEWQDNDLHPDKDQIRIKDLLTLSSGLSQDLFPISNSDNRYQYAIDQLEMKNHPNDKFSYGPSNYYVFGVLLERKLNSMGTSQNPLQYLENEIFKKIGLEYERWDYDQSGNPNIPNGCTLTPRNWVKYGQFLLNNGLWNGEQIIQPALLDEMFVANGPNPAHGNFAWLNNMNGYGFNITDSAPSGSSGGYIYHSGYTEIIAGLGAGKNRMYLIPSLNTIIIRQTQLDEDSFEDDDFLSLLLN